MAFKPITDPQLREFRLLAKKAGVGSNEFQIARSNGSLRRAIEILKPGSFDLGKLEPPPGARLHTVHVRFKPDREWQEAVNAGGPDTPSDYDVWKVGDLYPPTGTEEIEEDLILLNYPRGGMSWDKAHAWAEEKKLEKTVPREVFAVGEHHPNLHDQLGHDPMYVVATKECTFHGSRRACGVWWDGAGREAVLDRVDGPSAERDWVIFRVPVLKI